MVRSNVGKLQRFLRDPSVIDAGAVLLLVALSPFDSRLQLLGCSSYLLAAIVRVAVSRLLS